MNKPDWKDAPEWANWLAQDHDGEWWWFRDEPWLDNGTWMPIDFDDSEGSYIRANENYIPSSSYGFDFQKSLEKKP